MAEIVWVLNSFYKNSRTQVAEVLIPLLTSDGIHLEDSDQIVAALEQMANANVDFIDAYLAEVARQVRQLSHLTKTLGVWMCLGSGQSSNARKGRGDRGVWGKGDR